ncbi:hypothetical protein ABPG72_011711 [Tetrahymena utriculariae]
MSQPYEILKTSVVQENADIELIQQTQQRTEADIHDIDTQRGKDHTNLNQEQISETKEDDTLLLSANGSSKKKTICWILINLLGFLLILCNQMFISQKCMYSLDSECEELFFEKRKYLWVLQAIVNSIIITLWILKFLEFNYKSIFYASLIIFSYLVVHMFGSQISTKEYAGFVNFAQLQIIIQLIQICLGPILKKKLKNKCKYVILIIVCIVLVVILTLIPWLKNSEQCKSWNYGINGEIQEYNENADFKDFEKYKPVQEQQYCSILSPKFCWFYSLDFIFDIQKQFPQYNCQSIHHSEKILDLFNKNIENHRYIAYPFSIQESEISTNYQSLALQNLKGFDNVKDAHLDGHEVILDRLNNRYHIQINQNKTLSQERKYISQNKTTKSIVDNILLINVNGVSRVQMHAKLPKTIEWFKKFNSNITANQALNSLEILIETQNNHSSVEYMRYNSFNFKKDIQSLQLFYGQANFNENEEKLDSIFDFFKNEGYVTGYSNTFCSPSSQKQQKNLKQYIKPIIKDHDSSPTFACDPNFEDPQQSFKWLKGSESFFTRCLYGEHIHSYSLNYTQSFFDKYDSNKKFFMLEFAEGRERTGKIVKNIDQDLFSFLETNQSFLEKTMIILISSQGQPDSKTIYSLLSLQAEKISKKLPFLMMRIPTEIDQKLRKNLIENSQKLTTIRNLHFTLKHLANGTDFKQQEESLLSQLSTYNQCTDIGISKKDCSCEYSIQY